MKFSWLCIPLIFLTLSVTLNSWQRDRIQVAPESAISGNTVPTHQAFRAHKDFYTDAFATARVQNQQPEAAKNIPAVIVNHHLLAPSLIAQAMKAVSHLDPGTVVIISPNHFGAGNAGVLTSDYDWDTPYGTLTADHELIEKIISQTNIQIDEAPFKKEHGIFNIVAFVKATFPNAKIVPIIIKDVVPQKDAQKLAMQINDILPQNTLVVGSFDFSHYLPEAVAQFHDQQSRNILETLDEDMAYTMEIDSRPGLYTTLVFAKLRGARSFTMLERYSSALIIGDLDTLENTSYITGYFH